ncbi:class I SAM-dependent methyltransferase [Clostridium sp. BJN0001]|uniref:class I SAM-dependent DNA methyltransferase n=1 Tax=Clostridium sp. BJN0001 TaxID=2930219 RepID=UPI001FD1A3FA|nr:class I SAM-dependent methyltransferase [Clostridium sp. BJN0001]
MTYGEFANIYDELIYEDIDYDKISNYILEIYKKHNGSFSDYLDLACGTGNVSIRLSSDFKNRFIVDSSDDMLDVAYSKFREKKIKTKIICQDMAHLNLNHKFDLITSVLDSTNYIIDTEEILNYFSSVKRHLKDDGIFIFDVNSYYKLSEIMGNNIFTYGTDDIFYTWENCFEEDVLNMFLTFFVKSENGLYERFEEEHNERAYKEEFLDECLKKTGFKVIDKFSGYSDKKVNDKSERIVYVVK